MCVKISSQYGLLINCNELAKINDTDAGAISIKYERCLEALTFQKFDLLMYQHLIYLGEVFQAWWAAW